MKKKESKIVNEIILGLDVSSSTIGWGLIKVENNEISLLSYGHIIPLKSKYPEIERLADTYNKIMELCNNLKPDKVVIENILLFMKGLSTAKTITVLATFNRTCALAAYHYNKNVEFIPVVTIRKYIKKHCKLNEIEKTDMPDIIRKHLSPQFEDIINRNNKVDKKTNDRADGIAVAWAEALKITER